MCAGRIGRLKAIFVPLYASQVVVGGGTSASGRHFYVTWFMRMLLRVIGKPVFPPRNKVSNAFMKSLARVSIGANLVFEAVQMAR